MKKQKGVTLLETILVLSLISIIVIGGLSLYSSATEKSKTNDVIMMISATVANSQNLIASSGSSFSVGLSQALDMGVLAPGFEDYLDHFTLYVQNKGQYYIYFDGILGQTTEKMCLDFYTHDFGQDCTYGPNVLFPTVSVNDAIVECSFFGDELYLELTWDTSGDWCK